MTLHAFPCAWIAASIALNGCSLLNAYGEIPLRESNDTCSNGIDDDLDGAEDCLDEDCRHLCPEAGGLQCRDLEDNDEDGFVDEGEPSCWPHASVTTGPFDEQGRELDCRTRVGTVLPREARDPPPLDGRVATLRGTQDCGAAAVLSISGACDRARTSTPITGGTIDSLSLEVELDREGAEFVLLLYPPREVGAFAVGQPLLVSLRRRTSAQNNDELVVSYPATEDAIQTTRTLEPPSSDWVAVTLTSSPSPTDGDQAMLRFSDPASGKVLAGPSDDVFDEAVRLPLGTSVGNPLEIEVAVGGPGQVTIRNFALERSPFLPCPTISVLPQVENSAAILTAALGDDWLCILAAGFGDAATAITDEFVYCPERDHGSPQFETNEGALHAWRTNRRAETSQSDPYEIDDESTIGLGVRAGALAWDEGAGVFDGILLGSDPGGDGLFRVRSSDCINWNIERLETPNSALAFPLLYEIRGEQRELLFATPGGPYAVDPGMYDQHGCLPSDHAGDRIPLIKPASDEAATYSRAELHRAFAGTRTEQFQVNSAGTLPALLGWTVGCQPARLVQDPPRTWPLRVNQLIRVGGTHAVLASGPGGVEVVLDVDGASTPANRRGADGELIAQPLRQPSGIAGTFDAAAVREAHLVLFPQLDVSPELNGLLIYRGFHQVMQVDDGETIGEDVTDPASCYAPNGVPALGRAGGTLRYLGGQVGIVPVSIEIAR